MKAMLNEGQVFDSDRTRRLTRAFDLTLAQLDVAAFDHDVRKRLARTLLKIARRHADDATSEYLATATVEVVRASSAPADQPSAWLQTLRVTPAPTIVPWHLVQKMRLRLNKKRNETNRQLM